MDPMQWVRWEAMMISALHCSNVPFLDLALSSSRPIQLNSTSMPTKQQHPGAELFWLRGMLCRNLRRREKQCFDPFSIFATVLTGSWQSTLAPRLTRTELFDLTGGLSRFVVLIVFGIKRRIVLVSCLCKICYFDGDSYCPLHVFRSVIGLSKLRVQKLCRKCDS